MINQLISCFLIAVALSMDTFSLSLGIGTFKLSKKNIVKLSFIVGVMHFIMPFLGNLIGNNLISFFSLNSNKLLGFILLFLALNIFIEMFKEEKIEIDLSLWGMFIFAFGVSIDAFSSGLGLNALKLNKYLAMLIFSVVSFTFTILGLNLGKYASNHLGKKASILGLVLLLILGLFHICK